MSMSKFKATGKKIHAFHNRIEHAEFYEAASDTGRDEEFMRRINNFALKKLNRNDVAIFTMDLCNSKVSSHGFQMPEDTLHQIARKTPGAPFMTLHDMDRLPVGRFFDARVIQRGKEFAVSADVYLTTNRDFMISQIQAGIYSEVSIGITFTQAECSICGADLMRCSHMPQDRYDGKLCVALVRGVKDVDEGSMVPRGAAPGAAFTLAASAAGIVDAEMDLLQQLEARPERAEADAPEDAELEPEPYNAGLEIAERMKRVSVPENWGSRK